LTTGRRNSRSVARRQAAGRRPASGFTLLELILVLALISVVLALAAPSLHGFSDSRQTADTAIRVAALTHWARSQAIAQGRPYRLHVDPLGGFCWLTVQRAGAYVPVDDQVASRLVPPEGVSLSLESALPDRPVPYVQFYPSGRCDMASIEVRGRQGEVFLVACDTPTDRFRVISPAEASKP